MCLPDTLDNFNKALLKAFHHPREPSTAWPRSKDKHYKPSVKSVTHALKELKKRNKKTSTKLIYNSSDKSRSYDDDFWGEVNARKEKYAINRRLKQQRKREIQEIIKFQAARLNAKKYYIRMKKQAICQQRHTLFLQTEKDALSIKRMQLYSHNNLLRHLNEERHAISNLYEDYPMDRRSHAHLKVDPMLHENLYRNLFLMHLHRRQYIIRKTSLHRQRYERFMLLLEGIVQLLLLGKEERQLSKLTLNNHVHHWSSVNF